MCSVTARARPGRGVSRAGPEDRGGRTPAGLHGGHRPALCQQQGKVGKPQHPPTAVSLFVSVSAGQGRRQAGRL